MPSLPVKYRPTAFGDVRGQQRVLRVLQNQLERREFRPVYLFAGGAGTGKTTVARIFANAIVRYPGGLIEIDGASHAGVDAIIEIRENAYLRPIATEYKVYIIDECHSLTSIAFNALLKVLEEPPAYTIFILCTTDPGKLPATILSRAQRLSFGRIDRREVLSRLSEVIMAEGRQVQQPLLEAIATKAQGGMRDALSLLDAVLSYVTQDPVTLEEAAPIVGLVDEALYLQLAYELLSERGAEALKLLQTAHNEGRDWVGFFSGWCDFVLRLRETQLLGHPAWNGWMDGEAIQVFVEQASASRLLAWIDSSLEVLGRLRYDPVPAYRIEGFFLKGG